MVISVQEEHISQAKALGVDCQLSCFMFVLLDIRYGQKIGFEVKNDNHVAKEDATSILFQEKQTVLKKTRAISQNLKISDSDLWKTLSNCTDFIKAEKSKKCLNNHTFILATNKSENNNKFVRSLNKFKVDKALTKLKELNDRTQDSTIRNYIKNVVSLRKRKIKVFLPKLTTTLL